MQLSTLLRIYNLTQTTLAQTTLQHHHVEFKPEWNMDDDFQNLFAVQIVFSLLVHFC